MSSTSYPSASARRAVSRQCSAERARDAMTAKRNRRTVGRLATPAWAVAAYAPRFEEAGGPAGDGGHEEARRVDSAFESDGRRVRAVADRTGQSNSSPSEGNGPAAARGREDRKHDGSRHQLGRRRARADTEHVRGARLR